MLEDQQADQRQAAGEREQARNEPQDHQRDHVAEQQDTTREEAVSTDQSRRAPRIFARVIPPHLRGNQQAVQRQREQQPARLEEGRAGDDRLNEKMRRE